MSQRNLGWEQKIRYFSKFLGYDDEDFDETLDQSIKSGLQKKPLKGIKVIQNPPLYQSMLLNSEYGQQLQKKWLNIIRTPYRLASKSELLKLTFSGTCYAHKVLPWLGQNKQKINLKLFNLKLLQYRNILNINNQFKLQKISSQLQIMNMKIGRNPLSELLAILMLYRQDIQYSQTLMLIGQTVHQYLFDAPILAFSLLYVMCCSNVFLPILTNQTEIIKQMVNQICTNIKSNCSSATFLIRDKIPLEQFINNMICCVWLNISQHRSGFRQKILYYLLINGMSLPAVSRVCQATIIGLSRLLNQGNRQKSIAALNNPQAILDQQVFLNYLFFDY